MKTFLFSLILSLSSTPLFAVEVKFIGPCSSTPLLKVERSFVPESVGKTTVEVLRLANIPFEGSQEGLKSVFGTPTGTGAMEVLGPNEIRAYGWCYSLNGVSPEVYPHQIMIEAADDQIEWLYGYAHYKDGQWISQCDPAHLISPDFLCPKN